MTYRFTEHGKGYQLGKTLQSWRPQFNTIVSWVPEGSSVLDVGCGDGVLGNTLIKEKGCRVSGFDVDSVGVTESRRKGLITRVHDANMPFPYKSKRFDVAICNELLEFVEKPNVVIAETLRVGKRAIIEFPNFGFWFYRAELLFGRFPKLALYGHRWWNTRQTKFFTFTDFMELPAIKRATVTRVAGIDWKNRNVSYLATHIPNLFARSVLIEAHT